jgi:hypothetical protein
LMGERILCVLLCALEILKRLGRRRIGDSDSVLGAQELRILSSACIILVFIDVREVVYIHFVSHFVLANIL